MNRFRFILLGMLFSTVAIADEWTYSDVARVVAVSDLHGAHGTFVSTMQAAGIVDDAEQWVGGESHLVIAGDILDRGPDSRQILDFLMRLEGEAFAAGGRVHVLIGNHEVMNLVGDLRYVADEEYSAFAAQSDLETRNFWYQKLLARDGDEALTRVQFDAQFPIGFFAHRAAFSAAGHYGAWLLDKPLMVVINNTAFVHGGLTPLVTELGLDGVNTRLMDDVRDYLRILPELESAGALLPMDEFFDHPAILQSYDAAASTELAASITEFLALNASPVHDADGPLWYRGNIACSAVVEIDRLEASLAAIGAERVVIGHMPTPTREITTRFDGRVIEVDTGMYAAAYQGFGSALILQGADISSVRAPSSTLRATRSHPRQVGERPNGFLSLERTLELLAEGEIVSQNETDGVTYVTVGDGGVELSARFAAAQGKGFYPELAAFRLDRYLELDMVPATVQRQVGKNDGSLQLHLPHAVNEQQRAETGRGGDARCALADQWKAMYQFDALIYNQGRTQTSMLYDRKAGWHLISISHELAFAPKKGTPEYLESLDLSLNPQWIQRLNALTDEQIEALFAEVLDKRRRRSLAKRRDTMLAW